MRSTLVLAQLSLFLTSVHAFFPWDVSEHCPFEGGCSSHKRDLKDQDALGSDAVDAIKAINFPGFHVGPQITKESLVSRNILTNTQKRLLDPSQITLWRTTWNYEPRITDIKPCRPKNPNPNELPVRFNVFPASMRDSSPLLSERGHPSLRGRACIALSQRQTPLSRPQPPSLRMVPTFPTLPRSN